MFKWWVPATAFLRSVEDFTEISWPTACWGCGTEENLDIQEGAIGRTIVQTKKVGSSGPYNKYQTSVVASYRTPARICLCDDCKKYAELEQRTVRQYSLAAVLISAIIAIVTTLMFAPQFDTVFNDAIITYSVLPLATIWVPLFFASKYLSYSGVSAHQSFYDIDFDERKHTRIFFRNRTFVEKFSELNRELYRVYHRPGLHIAHKDGGWQESMKNCTKVTCGIGLFAFLCCISPFFALGILQLVSASTQTNSVFFAFIGLDIILSFVAGWIITGPILRRKYHSISFQYPGVSGDVEIKA